MRKKKHQNIRKKGMPPGTLIYTGSRSKSPLAVHSIWYSEQSFVELDGFHIELVSKPNGFTWYDVKGLTDPQLISQIGESLNIHPLALEDILDTQQRPKLEEYENGLFLILNNLKLDELKEDLITEQISIFFGRNFVVSFQEDMDDTFSNVRQRITDDRGRVRKKGADYLAYTLFDTVVDHYYIVHDELETELETLDLSIHERGAEPNSKSKIYHLKRILNQFKRHAVPLRDASTKFHHIDHRFVDESNHLFFRDVADHMAQILDNIDNSRDALTNIQELFNAEVGNKMNNVMRLLTVISTIFIPLSFITGIFGMNFDYMPGLHNPYGFVGLSVLMISLMVGMLLYFKKKNWI